MRILLRWMSLFSLVGLLGCPSAEKGATTDLAAAADLTATSLDLFAADLVGTPPPDLTIASSADLLVTEAADLLVAATADLTLTSKPDLPACADLDLLVEPGVNFGVPSGGTNTLSITVTRGSVTGPLTVTANDPESDVSAPGVVIADGDSTATLTFTAVATVPGLGGFITVTVSTGSCIAEQTVNYNIGGSGDFAMTLEPTAKSISRDTSDVVLIKLDRIAAFGHQVTITATGLPSGVTVSPLSLTGIEEEANLTFTVSPTATLGTVDVTITGTATPGADPITHSATLALTITGVPAFTLALESSTIEVQQTQMTELGLTVVRDSGYTAALTTELLQAPTGVTAAQGSFGVSGLTSDLEISASASARLLVPTQATVRTTDGTVARPLPLEILVTPAPDPQRDDTFGHHGVVVNVEERDGGDYPLAVKAVSGGKTLVLSAYSRRRLNADGSPDATFTTTGYGLIAQGATIDQQSGESYVAQVSDAGVASVVKLDPQGAIDTDFGTSGTATFVVPGVNRGFAALAAGGGKVYVGLFAEFATNDYVVTRLDASDGAVDSSFAAAGTYIHDSGVSEYLSTLLPLPDGGVLLVGSYPGAMFPSSPILLVRLDADGDPLASFDGDGVRSLESVSTVGANFAVLDGDHVLLAGNGFADETIFGELKRVSVTTGQLDTSFGGDGIVNVPGLNQIWTMQLDGAGRIVLGGRDQPYNGVDAGMYLARLTSQGAYDATFSSDGIARIAGGTPLSYRQACTAIHIDGDGNYLAFGQFQPNHFIAKYVP